MIFFDEYKAVDGGVCAPRGFVAGGVNAGIKANSQKNDLAVIYCEKPCTAVALYTQNKVKGAPILLTQKHLENRTAQAVVVNSGNANTCNADGLDIARQMCEITARELMLNPEDIIVASTGVIGQRLSISPIEAALPGLCASLSEAGSAEACSAIMTTDTRKKELAVEFILDGRPCKIGGISKGSGMINPNMATMLAFFTTDADISAEMLDKALRRVNAVTYNRVSVDGDTSTNDMVTVMASGLAGNGRIADEGEAYEAFVGGLYAVMMNLARETARDGEGATKLLECAVVGAASEAVAEAVAKSVIGSSLLKAAIFAADANWGRILCAIGYADADFDITRVSVELRSSYGSIIVYENGSATDFSDEEAHKLLLEDEITVYVDMHSGGAGAVAWGCDLTYDYVKINAEYRS